MTLVTRAAPPAYHKKVSGKHHRHNKTYHKTYWPYLPLLAVVIAGALLNSVLPGHGVLGYATDMSAQSLLDGTNAQRASNGESGLTLNQQLDNAAQTKANDMSARNYWSHNTPDGQTPWTFITAAGYSYQLAGENLAYGFSTASDTITGWMNSPEHRANILNAGYKDVGFGFINISDYQNNGPETLVVAMYGAQATTAPVAVASPQPAATGSSAGGSAASDTSAQSDPATASSPPATAADPVEAGSQTAIVTPETKDNVQLTGKAQTVSRVQILTAGKAPWSLFVLSLIGSAALIAFLLRHGFAWHKVFIKGERFLLHHPLLDLMLVSTATVVFLLVHQAGVIR